MIVKLDQLLAIIHQKRSEGKTIGRTNGCFDILHPGHVHTFSEAKKHCDVLIVAINSDLSPYRKTKPGRPIHDHTYRSMIVDSIKYVDYVLLFDTETPLDSIVSIMPDVLVKGGDYSLNHVVGHKEVISHGGKVVLVPLLGSYSTTSSVQKILNKK